MAQVMEKGNEQLEILANSWVICPMRCPVMPNPGGAGGENEETSRVRPMSIGDFALPDNFAHLTCLFHFVMLQLPCP